MTVPTPLTFYILLALAEGDSCPAEIRRQIARDAASTFIPEEGALYRALKRLVAEGLIEPAAKLGANYYRLSRPGRVVLVSERARVGRAATLLHQRV